MAANLFESVERVGVRREELTDPLGLDANELTDPNKGIDWDVLVAVLERLSQVLDGDVERLRDVGRAMVNVPAYAPLQRIGRAVFSLKSLYVAGERWVATADVPHLALVLSFPSNDRLCLRLMIPEPYAPSATYLTTFEGLVCAVPTLLGLPPAKIASSTITPRQLDLILDLPPSQSILERTRRVARVAIHGEDALLLFESQRRAIADGLEATRRSTAEIVTLFDRLPDLVVIHREGKIVWANRAAVRTCGHRDTSEVIGQNLVGLFHASSQTFANERINGIIEDESAPDLASASLVARDGSRVLVEVSPARAVSFGGKEARLLVARDVTERKRLEQQLAIADRLASVGMLAAGVAHEINNPLAYVLNNIEIARREMTSFGEGAESGRAALSVALEGVDRIRTITRELLALARVDDQAMGVVDPVSVIESTLALTMPQIAERATLVRDLVPTPLVRGTVSRVGQVLLNLVANAVEAMSPDARASNVLRVGARPFKNGAVIEVSDSGVGIAPEHAPHVFEPFFTTKSSGTGTGLGLAISQRLASEMGGELSFESAERAGTVFRLTLLPGEEEVLGSNPSRDPPT